MTTTAIGTTAPRSTSAAPIELEPPSATTGAWGHFYPLDHGATRCWLQWANSRRGQHKLQSWNDGWVAGGPDSRRWTNDDLVAPVGGSRTDWMQAQLVKQAQRGDGDAAVTLTMQLRPGLLRLVRKTTVFQPIGNQFGTSFGSGKTVRDDAKDSVLSAFQLVLFNHNLERRPTKIAANLLLDTRQLLWRDSNRSGRIESAIPSFENGNHYLSSTLQDQTLYTDELASLGTAIRSLPGSSASRRLTTELAYRSWVLEESNASIARQLSISTEVVNTRLHRLRSVFKQQANRSS